MNKIKQLTEGTVDIYLYGDVESDGWWSDSETSGKSFKDRIKELGNISEINLHINSLGGDVIEGIAIFNLLKQHSAKINVYIDGFACSIASVIAMAGDTIYMPKNSMMMIHNCWTYAEGNAKELRKRAEDLDKIMESSIESYLSKINIEREELIKLLDEEAWLTAEECYSMGFADVLMPLSETIAQQSATKTISKLLLDNQRLKEKLNKNNSSKDKLVDTIVEAFKSTEGELLKDSNKEETVGIFKNLKQNKDKKQEKTKTLFESFLNVILKEEN